MSYPYTVNGAIPGPNDLLSQSQGQIQTNFANIVGWSDVDHIQYGATNSGTHAQITIVTPESAPSPTGTTGVVTTQAPVSNSELFYTNASANIQITNSVLSSSGGSGMLPGGLQIRCGVASTPTPQTFSPQFPTGCISVVATASSSGSQVNVTAISATGFTVVANPSGTVSYYWIAVGY